jgi:hypothetical protein
MANFTVTISPSAVNSINAKWCIVGVTEWLASGVNTTLAVAGQIIAFRSVAGYMTPANITITAGMISALGTTATYTATSWLSTWGPPMCGCLYNGQILMGGSYHTAEASFPSDSRIVRWSEIGAFRFLGATANEKKNEAGFAYMGNTSSETVMAMLPLKTAIVVYSTHSVTVLKPINQPAPSYGIDCIVEGVGILNPLAVAGNKNMHLYVDKNGTLRKISYGKYGEGIVDTPLGYKQIFGPMQTSFNLSTLAGFIGITYNPDEDEFYISDGLTSYLYTEEGGLAEIGESITSYVNTKNLIISSELFSAETTHTLGCVTQISGKTYLYVETDIIDFGLSAIKTINQVEISGDLGATSAEVMIKWRNNRSSTFTSTTWRRCSPNGVATPIVSGTEFKICIRTTPYANLSINNITVEWKMSDKTSIRGNYASGASS